MRKFFTALALAGLTAYSVSAHAEEKTLGCETSNGARTFSLLFNDQTNQATLKGEIDVPTLAHSFKIERDAETDPNNQRQQMTMTIEDPTIIGGALDGNQIHRIPVEATFEVGGQYNSVFFKIEGANLNPFKTILCPLPGRAMGLD